MQNTYQEKILDLETTNNSPRVKLEGGIKFKIKKYLNRVIIFLYYTKKLFQ